MQNPVIQRIKRRAEVCRSLPVTCGRRGNDTGNYLVTVVSLQCAVGSFSENGKSPHSKPFTFLLLPAAKCRSGMFFTLRAPYVRNPDTGQRRHDRQRRQDARPCQRQHDAPLCEGSRLVDHARHGGRRRKHGFVADVGHARNFRKARTAKETRPPCANEDKSSSLGFFAWGGCLAGSGGGDGCSLCLCSIK